MAIYKRGAPRNRAPNILEEPIEYYSIVGTEAVRRSEGEYLAQFEHINGAVDSTRLSYMSNGALDPLIDSQPEVDSLAYAMFLHNFCFPPEIGLVDLDFNPLDPSCPELSLGEDIGPELAMDWLHQEDEEFDPEIFDRIDYDRLARYVPRYVFPWEHDEVRHWPSHWGALLMHLHHNPQLLVAFMKPNA